MKKNNLLIEKTWTSIYKRWFESHLKGLYAFVALFLIYVFFFVYVGNHPQNLRLLLTISWILDFTGYVILVSITVPRICGGTFPVWQLTALAVALVASILSICSLRLSIGLLPVAVTVVMSALCLSIKTTNKMKGEK